MNGSVQMFVGEVGCWLVVFGFWIYKRYIAAQPDAPLLAGGYQPVSEDADPDSAIDDLDPLRRSISSQEAAGPAAKALVLNADGRRELVGWRVILLAAPACCDITGTTLMNVGLLFVAASIYQMTRGALVLFVGLFSVIFLRRKLYAYQWFALFVAVLGVAIVGLAGALFKDSKAVAGSSVPLSEIPDTIIHGLIAVRSEVEETARSPAAVRTIIGVLLIAGAQIFTATQFVLEEWILENYALQPLKVVSWEGLFGLIVTLVGMVILHFAVGRTDAGRHGYFDAREGWREISHNKAIGVSSILIMISIGYVPHYYPSYLRTNCLPAASTSSASPSPAPSPRHPAPPLIRAARSSSGLYP
jgi:drug/metabolite transporter (DMT)-like permease